MVSPSAGRVERVYCHRVIAIPHMVRFHVATEIRVDYVLVASLSAEVGSLRFVARDDGRGCHDRQKCSGGGIQCSRSVTITVDI